MTQTELASARDIAEIIGLSAERTRVILSKMDDVEPVGENRNRMYMLKKCFLKRIVYGGSLWD